MVGYAMSKITASNPIPNFKNFEHQSLSTKKARKKCYSSPVSAPKAPIRSCPVPRTFSIFKNEEPRPVSFRQNADTSFITDSPIYSLNKGTYFEQCYTLEKALGKGSFGEVFKVYSKETGEAYACKRTLLKYRGESDRSRRIEEVKKHEQLPSHMNCVKFFRAWEEKNHLYLLTEVCQSTLAEIMANKHELPESQIWYYIVDILQGLHHLHMHTLIHMDVKPENIFLGLDGYCKLGDFGLVIDFSNGYPTEAVEGDPKYLAPECLQGVYTPAADIFSLGMVSLEMATDLYLPQMGPHWHELRSGQLPEVARLKVSVELQELLEGFLNPNPKMRLLSTMAFQFKSIRRIRKQRALALSFKNGANTVKSFLQSIFVWPLSLVSFISLVSYERVFGLLHRFKPLPSSCMPQDRTVVGDSSDDELSNEELKNFLLPSPLVKSTPISNVRRRVILPNKPNGSSPFQNEQEHTDSNKYSFNESSFSSLENSNDDLKLISGAQIETDLPLLKHSHQPSLESNSQLMNVTSRNLLDLFNSADNSDSD